MASRLLIFTMGAVQLLPRTVLTRPGGLPPRAEARRNGALVLEIVPFVFLPGPCCSWPKRDSFVSCGFVLDTWCWSLSRADTKSSKLDDFFFWCLCN